MSPEDCERERRRRGWTVEDLAARSGLVALTIQKFEAGLTQPRPGTFIALRRAFARAEFGALSPS
jgi:transcriptional regulator with XRE-family HTH domain